MFTYDTRTENFIKSCGVKPQYDEAVLFSDLKKDWRSSNLGRQKDVDEDAVQEYALRMENKELAPAVILIKTKDGYEILDGVQRLHAADLNGATRFAAYIIPSRTKMSTQHIIRICSNSRINGQHTPEKNWMLAQAVEVLYFIDHCSAEDIARGIGVKVDRVRDEIRYQKTSELIESTGYSGKMTDRRRSKWFVSQCGKSAEESDWVQAKGPIKTFVEKFEECKFRNGDATPHIEDFFAVKRSRSKDRLTQFRSKLEDFMSHQDIRVRLKKGGPIKHVDNLLSDIRRAKNCAQKALDDNSVIHDGDYARSIASELRELQFLAKKLTPHDIEFENRKSIYS